jgi:Glyoxalase/Bleomycin resistance protein/Dioxygenase superfamily
MNLLTLPSPKKVFHHPLLHGARPEPVEGFLRRHSGRQGILTESLDNHGWEMRCYMRDPDGYLIEVGRYSHASIERFQEFNR